MKKCLLIAAVMLFTFAVVFAGDAPWFDMKKCIFCQKLSDHDGLLDHMKWEHHIISDGCMSVTVVDDDYTDEYKTAMDEMMKVGTELSQGKIADPYMCGHCQAYGALIMKGVKMESVETSVGDIMMITSDDPALQKEIKAYAEHTMKAMQEMEGE